jgi:hypothetical protein
MASFVENDRRAPRLPLALSVELAHRGESWIARTGDLGPGGCLVHSPRPLIERAPLRLVLQAAALREPLAVAASVAWAREASLGLAFLPRQAGPGRDPEVWFRRLLHADPRLAAALVEVPPRLERDAAVYLLPAPGRLPPLGPDEVALLRHVQHGVTIEAVLSQSGLPQKRGVRALFGLFERRALTASLGRAGDAWKWRMLLAAAGHPPPPLPAELPPPSLPAIERGRPAPAATPPPVLAPVRPGAAPRATHLHRPAAPGALLRGDPATRRSADAQRRLDDALAHEAAGRLHEAIAALRQALTLAPRDPEIARRLGELAFRDRRRG